MDKGMSRSEFLQKGAKSALTLAVITACGDLIPLGAETKAKLDKVMAKPGGEIISLKELKVKGAVNTEINGKKAIILYNDGDIRAFMNVCTHKGGPTDISAGKLVCKWHGAQFDPLSGEALKKPAPTGSKLEQIPMTLVNGKLFAK